MPQPQTRRANGKSRPATRRRTRRPRSLIETAEQKIVMSEDGVLISYETIGDRGPVIVLANGLGGRLYSWEPVVEGLGDRYRFITWDYRGLFLSRAPEKIRQLSMGDHAKDIGAILDAEGVESAIFMGWSMGVQVSLEFVTRFPERVEKLILLNGTFGQALKTAFQPFVRFPYIDIVLHEAIDALRSRPNLVRSIARIATDERVLEAQTKILSKLIPQPNIGRFFKQYVSDIFSGDHFSNYLRLFQELDAHSTYHHLREIDQRTLVVYGLLDFLTPSYQSRQMVRRMPNADGFRIAAASHFILLEHPKPLVRRLEAFLAS